MVKNAIVTGAGSGVGRAVAIMLAEEGWNVALVGRRAETLKETSQLASKANQRFLICECDVADWEQVKKAAAYILSEFGAIEALVNSAGTNVPDRSLALLSIDGYHRMINANLNGAFYWIHSVLPNMRSRRSGTIVNIVSDAGKQASPKAGAGYVASKFGLAGLTQCINAEERSNGIRACAVFPGDIDTPLLNKRPAPPDEAARAKMLKPEDVARCVMLCINMPHHVIVEEILVRPR
ncbi:MAG: SDR family oxidoreductase [Verrucomicrobiia bacterium]|jgi:NADP-dependent 3-hydroxy acid dehydrogenase YdfG